MRINKMITKGKMPSYFIKLTLSTNSVRKCMEISPENFYLNILMGLNFAVNVEQ